MLYENTYCSLCAKDWFFIASPVVHVLAICKNLQSVIILRKWAYSVQEKFMRLSGHPANEYRKYCAGWSTFLLHVAVYVQVMCLTRAVVAVLWCKWIATCMCLCDVKACERLNTKQPKLWSLPLRRVISDTGLYLLCSLLITSYNET